MELDNKFEIDIKDYFKLKVSDRKELSQIIFEHFKPSINNNPLSIISLRSAFVIKLEEYEKQERFEMCDLYKRVIFEIDHFKFTPNDFMSE